METEQLIFLVEGASGLTPIKNTIIALHKCMLVSLSKGCHKLVNHSVFPSYLWAYAAPRGAESTWRSGMQLYYSAPCTSRCRQVMSELKSSALRRGHLPEELLSVCLLSYSDLPWQLFPRLYFPIHFPARSCSCARVLLFLFRCFIWFNSPGENNCIGNITHCRAHTWHRGVQGTHNYLECFQGNNAAPSPVSYATHSDTHSAWSEWSRCHLGFGLCSGLNALCVHVCYYEMLQADNPSVLDMINNSIILH